MIISQERLEDRRQRVENKSCKKHRHHKKSTNKQIVVDQFDKSGNISDLGSRVIKEFQRIEPPKIHKKEAESSVDDDKDEKNTSRSINVKVRRRRSKTGDLVKGLGLTTKQVDNYFDEEEVEHSEVNKD